MPWSKALPMQTQIVSGPTPRSRLGCKRASASVPSDLEDDRLDGSCDSHLEEIGDFIARDKPVAARRWVHELTLAAERAGSLPMSGRRVPEFARDDVREIIKRGYRLVNRIMEHQVEILTVFEGHRQLGLEILDSER